MYQFNIVSLMPSMFNALTDYGVSGRAYAGNFYALNIYNPRDYTHDAHRSVDDRPYGGGPGMVMMYQPIKNALDTIAIDSAKRCPNASKAQVILMSPQGVALTHQKVLSLLELSNITIICGRYEGVDERVVTHLADEEISIGDFVLSGGELPAMALMDAMIRQMDGVLGHAQSSVQDSFVNDRLDCPHYTRPYEADGHKAPDILLSGDHQAIEKWRADQAEIKTNRVRPDLIKNHKKNR